MRKAVLCAALVMVLGPSSSGAQSLTITESEALARLSTSSPRERAIRAGVELARADVVAAGRWPNPRLTVDRESVAGVTEYITMIAQPLPVTGRRDLEVQAASSLVSASSTRADDEVRRLRADLRLAFADLLSAQIRERELTVSRNRLRELADVLAKREAAGDAAGFDRLRAGREVLDLETDLVVAATERSRAQATLAGFLTDINDPSQVVAVAGTRARAPLPALEALLEEAESSRVELIALRHEVDAAGFAARAAQRRLVPEPEIVAGTKSSTLGAGDLGSVFTVHASLPLFDRGRPEQAIAAARAIQAEARAAAFRMVLRGQVGALREALVQRRAAADRYRSEAVTSATEIERIAQVSYDAGERGILELLDAYRLGASARVRQAALDLAVRQTEIELEFATGWEIPS
jgi:cobalt-zinc-cadmium efflux system outer membrane protein